MLNSDCIHSSSTSQPSIKVLVVDDSAFMRYAISHHLEGNPQIQIVGTARNGVEALDLVPKLNPDVITMDIEMPEMDGITTLREIMKRYPRPVIMLSSLTQEGSEATITALTIGAVDFVTKPTQKASINQVMDDVTAKIIRAASIHLNSSILQLKVKTPSTGSKPKTAIRSKGRHDPIVMIGASTGGPRALNSVISNIPLDIPAAFVIVQHMPAGFTHSLADRLNSQSTLTVQEAKQGDRLEVGKALLAPGGYHMTFDRQGVVSLNQNPPVHGVRPAVDVTLVSLIQLFGKDIVAAILTGMGNDGTNGATLLHSIGGSVIAEHESSCVVYGMPRSVVEAGAADEIVPLENIAGAISQRVQKMVKQN